MNNEENVGTQESEEVLAPVETTEENLVEGEVSPEVSEGTNDAPVAEEEEVEVLENE